MKHIHLEEVDSTQTWIKRNIHVLDPSQITLVSTPKQTHGIGRFNRTFVSAPHKSITASLYFTLPQNAAFIANLSQFLSICILEALKKHGHSISLKWPNDLFFHGKKIGGILCEIFSRNEKYDVILGFGINVNMQKEHLYDLSDIATSLLTETRLTCNIDMILSTIKEIFSADLNNFLKHGFALFKKEYDANLLFKDEFHLYSIDGVKQEAKLLETNMDGTILVQLRSGKTRKLFSNE